MSVESVCVCVSVCFWDGLLCVSMIQKAIGHNWEICIELLLMLRRWSDLFDKDKKQRAGSGLLNLTQS